MRRASSGLLLGAAVLCAAFSSAAAQPGPKPGAAPGRGQMGEVRAGQTVRGTLAPSDSVLADDGSYVEVWTYRGERGERISVSLSSQKFDTFLRVDLPPGVGTLAYDDDSGGGTNSRITLDLLADGTYQVVVNALRRGQSGSYALTVHSDRAGGSVPAAKDWARIYPGGGDPAERYAVLVGIEAYPSGRGNLRGPKDDVRVIREVLIDKYGFLPHNVVTLTDREGNREQIIQAVRRHLGQAGPDGVAVFYYSGHGMQLDADFAAAGEVDPETDGKDEAIAVWGAGQGGSLLLDDELGELSERLAAGRALFIFDSCNSGTVLRGGSSAALEGGKRRRVMVAASAEHESSWASGGDWPGGSYESVFTHFFVEQLRSADGATTFAQAVDGAFSPTTRFAKDRFGAAQSPRAEGTDVDTSIADFLRKN